MHEIEEVTKKIELKRVIFSDSTFNLDKKWLLKFSECYSKRIGIPFTVNLRANLIDEEIVKALAETNCCRLVRVGIEVGNEKLRREVLNKTYPTIVFIIWQCSWKNTKFLYVHISCLDCREKLLLMLLKL
jgi:radical SAM superfamily enzyme YgiQ (UPF0313 family)